MRFGKIASFSLPSRPLETSAKRRGHCRHPDDGGNDEDHEATMVMRALKLAITRAAARTVVSAGAGRAVKLRGELYQEYFEPIPDLRAVQSRSLSTVGSH